MGIKPLQKVPFFTDLKPSSRVLWFVLAVLSIAPLLPLSDFVGRPHWDIIQWVPFQNFTLSRNMLADVIGNILWFMAFGYLLHYQLHQDPVSRRTIPKVTIVACGISLSIEFFQVFCHSRFPAMTDVICNVLGAGLGGYVAEKQRASTATELWPATWLSKVIIEKRFNRQPILYRQVLPLD